MDKLNERIAVVETKVEGLEADVKEIRKDIKYIKDNDLVHLRRDRRYWAQMAALMTAVATTITYLYNLACGLGWI